ncbi:Hypothetical protein, putative [Bodo saltans]|uniref:Uncharacterized protein n=1 Tax=Bodo saltans TaxID=75058 RepID=A0A0S4JLX0_BODSA|nr:Hypothetical protein, putative [Bodo saltans]|eukprot:CUG92530.1 Hypothetical protein, putative [Bodo saltans]
MPPMNTHYVIPFASSAATLGDFSNSQIPNYHTATPQVAPSSSCAIDALAVGGHGAAIHKMSPALASYATTASTSPHQNHQHYNAWDVRGPSVVTDYSANIQKYTTQDLFPTKIRASLARSQSPPESSPSLPTVTARQQASLQLRSALGQQHLHRHPALIRPTIESGAVWGDAHSTTAPTFTPRDSLNSSAAFVASLDRLRRSESLIDESQDSMRTRRTAGSTKAAATAMDEGASAYGGGGSSHVSFCDEAVGAQQILGKDRAAGGAAESSGNRSTTHGRPPIAQPLSTTVASREHNVMPPPMCDTSVAFDVEIEDDAVAKSEQPAAPRRSQKELPDDEEDVFLDVRCEEDQHEIFFFEDDAVAKSEQPAAAPRRSQKELQDDEDDVFLDVRCEEDHHHERRRATTSSSQQRDASPAFSTNSFLTVLSGRAASARGISSELFDKATSPTRPTSTSSVVDDSRLRRPVDTNAFVSKWNHERSHPTTTTTSPPLTTTVADSEQRLRTLSVAMEAVVPSVPPQDASGTRPAAAAPFALSVPRERSPAFHEFIQMFGRNSEERDLMLLEVQRQRVAAEAAVIELQIKSMERDLKEASPLSRHLSSRTTLPPPLTHHEQHQRPQKSAAVDLTSAYPSQQSPPPPSSTLASPWRPQHQVTEATLQGNHAIHSPLPVAPSTAAATGFKPAPTRSQPKATTLQELFALAATTSSAARQTSTTRASSSSNAQQQRAISALLPRDDMRPTRLEELAASASPLPAATGAAGAASPGPSIPAAVSQKLLTIDRQGHLSSATSSAGHTGEGRSSSSSSQRNWSVSSPSAAGTPTTRGVATVLPLTLPFSPSDQKFAPIVYRNCSALRPLTRSLLSTLIRLDSGSNGSVTLTDCVTAVQSVLEKANVGPVDIANTSSFLAEIMPRVQHAHHGGGGGGSGATTAAAASTHSIPYAALVSTIVEIATEDPSRAHTPFAASLTSPQMNTNTRAQQQTSSYRHFDFGSPTFPQFA